MNEDSTKELTLSPELTEILLDYQQGLISTDDVSGRIDEMAKRNDILDKHSEFCKIWQATDGRWKTKLPDKNAKNGCKLVAKTHRKDLENLIVDWYNKQRGELKKPCLKSIFDEWIESKERETSPANANKLEYAWFKYYNDSEIVNIPFEKLTTGQIKDWLLNVIAERKLTKKQFKEMKSVINMMYDYAISYNLTTINLPRQIRGFSDRIFKEVEEKPIEEIVYTEETKQQVLDEAMRQFEKTGNTAYIGICLNFSLGLRVGELVALRQSCINEDGTIDIIREEVKTYTKDQNNGRHRNGYEIVNHTKTESGKRKLVLTPQAKHYIQMILNKNNERGVSDGDYIFVTKKGERMHDYAINNVLRRLNGVRNEKDNFIIKGRPSGNHAIRKTCISELHESMLVSDETIRCFAGHKDISTTRSCYVFQTKPITAYADAFTEVFDKKCNQL